MSRDTSSTKGDESVRSRHNDVVLAEFEPISVVITCYNHGHFLRDAIESVLAQTYQTKEIIVIDDGSTDNTAALARTYREIKYIYQKNQGLSAARNTGWRSCKGDFVVFLDADDRLLPDALAAGVRCLQAHPECAFVSGHFRYIRADGTLLREFSQIRIDRDHYRAFLRGNFIAMHATVMYRRAALKQMGGFDTSLAACEDYDLYLRISRSHPVYCHETVVAEYRQHNGNMSADAALMLRTAVDVLRSQKAFLNSDSPLRKAFRAGLRSWTAYYGKHLLWQLLRFCRQGEGKRAVRATFTLIRYGTYFLTASIIKESMKSCALARLGWLSKCLHRTRQTMWQRNSPPPPGKIDFGELRQPQLFRCDTNYSQGQRLDQYYIEHFLRREARLLKGHVLEIGNDYRAPKFAGVRTATITSIPFAQETQLLYELAALKDGNYDTLVMVQVLPFIFDLHAVLRHAHRVLIPGGILLAAVPGSCYVPNHVDGDRPYWGFTDLSVQTLLGSTFPARSIKIQSFGNVFVATAHAQHLTARDLTRMELNHRDEHYPFVLGFKAVKVVHN